MAKKQAKSFLDPRFLILDARLSRQSLNFPALSLTTAGKKKLYHVSRFRFLFRSWRAVTGSLRDSIYGTSCPEFIGTYYSPIRMDRLRNPCVLQ
jgi:hypothetical protein